MEIIFSTFNPNKFFEVSKILPRGWTMRSLSGIPGAVEPVENGETFKDNALIKSRYGYNLTGVPCFADDSGLEVDALGGAPGVYSARYAGERSKQEDNIEKLLKELSHHSLLSARLKTVIAWSDQKGDVIFEGVLEGMISRVPLGKNGFGYDSIFIPSGYTKTLANFTTGQKNQISHRAIAFCKFVDFLKKKS